MEGDSQNEHPSEVVWSVEDSTHEFFVSRLPANAAMTCIENIGERCCILDP